MIMSDPMTAKTCERVEGIVSALKAASDFPGSDDSHMDCHHMLEGMQLLVWAALGRRTVLKSGEFPPDATLDTVERDPSNRHYPDFFHMANGTRCDECVSYRQRIHALAVDLHDTQSAASEFDSERLETLLTLADQAARTAHTEHVEAAAVFLRETTRRIFNTPTKRVALPQDLRETLGVADFVYGPCGSHPLNALLDHPDLSESVNALPVSEAAPRTRLCGSKATRTGQPCGQRVASNASQCAVGHPIQ